MKVDVRAYRLNRGWTAKRLADEIGVTVDVVRNLEERGGRPRPDNAFKVAKHFHLTVADMWPETSEAVA